MEKTAIESHASKKKPSNVEVFLNIKNHLRHNGLLFKLNISGCLAFAIMPNND